MNNPNHKIIILAEPNQLNYILINYLVTQFNVIFVIYERRSLKRKLQLFKNRIKKLGLLKVLGQILFILYEQIFIGPSSSKKIQNLIRTCSLRSQNLVFGKEEDYIPKIKNYNCRKPSLPSLTVDNINHQPVEEIIKKEQSSLIVVSGTSIIKPPLLSLNKYFINLHLGITPKYRGVYGGFWAIYNQDFENMGTTVHLIDPGVDTGPILYQQKIKVNHTDTPRTIAAKQFLAGLDLMVKAINDVLASEQHNPPPTAVGVGVSENAHPNETIAPLPPKSAESKLWYHPTLSEYFKWKRIMAKYKRNS